MVLAYFLLDFDLAFDCLLRGSSFILACLLFGLSLVVVLHQFGFSLPSVGMYLGCIISLA